MPKRRNLYRVLCYGRKQKKTHGNKQKMYEEVRFFIHKVQQNGNTKKHRRLGGRITKRQGR